MTDDNAPAHDDEENECYFVQDLVAQALTHMDEGAMLTKFVLVAEGMDQHGHRAIFTSISPSALPWDTQGLLQFAINREQAWMTIREFRAAGDQEE